MNLSRHSKSRSSSRLNRNKEPSTINPLENEEEAEANERVEYDSFTRDYENPEKADAVSENLALQIES